MRRTPFLGFVIGITVIIGALTVLFWPEAVSTNLGENGSSMSALSASSLSVQYGAYDDSVDMRGESALLFFASDDPFSDASEAFLQDAYEAGTAHVSAYRLEFGSSTGARLTHGVLVPNTFVLIDAAGERVAAVMHPSQEELSILLRGNIPVPPKP